MKFESVLDSQLAEAVNIVNRIEALSSLCGERLAEILNSEKGKEDQFLLTALQFNRLNYESISSISILLKYGHISEAYVLLRWLLELGNLYYYLRENETEYHEWLSGKKIAPSTVRKFLEKKGWATWQKTYSDWCNVVHGNAEYVEGCFTISRMKPINDDQVLILSQALRNLMFTSHKINNISGNLLKDLLEVGPYNEIAREYISTEKAVFAFSDEHNKREAKRIKELDDATEAAR